MINPIFISRRFGIVTTLKKVVNELSQVAPAGGDTEGAFDACIAAVAHKKFERLDIVSLLKEKHVVFDVKCTLDRNIVDGRL